MPLVVQMHGEPGSGKSTLARALAPRIGAVALDKDVIKSAILRTGTSEAAAGPAAYEVYFDIAGALTAQGHAVILDNPVFWPRVEERWLALARASGSPHVLIECLCDDRTELRRRLAARDGLESHPRRPLELERHPGAVATAFEPRLRLDTLRPLPELVDEALRYISNAAVPA